MNFPQVTGHPIPKICETDGTPFEKKIIHQVWTLADVGFVWCIAEIAENGREAFGYANLNCDRDAEWGYIDLEDIQKNGAKLVVVPTMPFEEVIREIYPKNGCPKCGSDRYAYHIILEKCDIQQTEDELELWLCGDCHYQPFTGIKETSGLVSLSLQVHTAWTDR